MKITKEQQKKGRELMQTLVTKAWESATFKEQLINNPEATIKEVTGVNSLPEESKIVVEDQTDSNIIYLNIPRKVNLENFELTDDQLEVVAGGVFPVIIAGVAVGSALGAIYNKYIK